MQESRNLRDWKFRDLLKDVLKSPPNCWRTKPSSNLLLFLFNLIISDLKGQKCVPLDRLLQRLMKLTSNRSRQILCEHKIPALKLTRAFGDSVGESRSKGRRRGAKIGPCSVWCVWVQEHAGDRSEKEIRLGFVSTAKRDLNKFFMVAACESLSIQRCERSQTIDL